jgi:hypothetical protein
MRLVKIEDWAASVVKTAESISQELGFAAARPNGEEAKTPPKRSRRAPRRKA